MGAEGNAEFRGWAEQVRKECCLAFWYLEYITELGNRRQLYERMHTDVPLIACQSHLIAIEDGLLMLISRLIEGGGGSKRRSAIKLVRRLVEEGGGLDRDAILQAKRLRSKFDALDADLVRNSVLFYRDEELAHLLAPKGSDQRAHRPPEGDVSRRERVEFAVHVLDLTAQAVQLVCDFEAHIERGKAKSKISAYFDMIELSHD